MIFLKKKICPRKKYVQEMQYCALQAGTAERQAYIFVNNFQGYNKILMRKQKLNINIQQKYPTNNTDREHTENDSQFNVMLVYNSIWNIFGNTL